MARPCTLYNITSRLVPYVEAWRWQKVLVRRAMDAQRAGRPHADSLLVVEHPPVYTLGRGSSVANMKFDPRDPGCPHTVHRVERGGEVRSHISVVLGLATRRARRKCTRRNITHISGC
jgi:lipoyl(octanoyl) transferase